MCVCYIKKKQQKKGEENSNIRKTMDLTLRMLGRPDLAKYLTRSGNIKSFDAIIKEQQPHIISKRNSYKNLEEAFFGKDNKDNKEKNEKVKENCTNDIHENQDSVSPTDKKECQDKQSNEMNDNKQVIDTNGSTTNMRWFNLLLLLGFFFVVTCIILLCITRKWKRAKLTNGRSIHLEDKGRSNGCTCNCSDIESGSLDHYSPKYSRDYKNDQDKSRALLKKKKKEKIKDRNYFDSSIKKSSKAKEKTKKHKYKRKSLKTKDFNEGKLDRKRTRSDMIHDYKNYPVCGCCKCTANYK